MELPIILIFINAEKNVVVETVKGPFWEITFEKLNKVC